MARAAAIANQCFFVSVNAASTMAAPVNVVYEPIASSSPMTAFEATIARQTRP